MWKKKKKKKTKLLVAQFNEHVNRKTRCKSSKYLCLGLWVNFKPPNSKKKNAMMMMYMIECIFHFNCHSKPCEKACLVNYDNWISTNHHHAYKQTLANKAWKLKHICHFNTHPALNMRCTRIYSLFDKWRRVGFLGKPDVPLIIWGLYVIFKLLLNLLMYLTSCPLGPKPLLVCKVSSPNTENERDQTTVRYVDIIIFFYHMHTCVLETSTRRKKILFIKNIY